MCKQIETSETLVSRIVGTYWALADCHKGQWSSEYRALCKLSQFYTPGRMESSSRLDGQEREEYERICAALLAR